MPRYDFQCKSCENIQEVNCKIAELDSIKPACSKCGSDEMHQTFVTANHAFMAPEMLGRKKAPQDFRDFLGAIHKAHGPASQIRVR